VLDSSAFAYQFSIIFASANVGQSKWASDPEMRFCRHIRGNLGRYEDPLRQNLPEKLSRLWTGHSGSRVASSVLSFQLQLSVLRSYLAMLENSAMSSPFLGATATQVGRAAMPISKEVQVPYPDVAIHFLYCATHCSSIA
jgi:hypothetical protein